ncbi:MAG: SurA N-terminal domain-containing protein [Nitrospiraceae bacterium]|nr:SurA N-terminal domain-containing protein [Nitrospiraceae bacterium]
MRRSVLPVIVSVVVWGLVSGCARQPVAVVNGRAIGVETLDRAMKERVREHARQKVDVDRERLKRAVLAQLVDERLVLDEAAKRGIRVPDDEVNAEVDSVREKMGSGPFQKMLDASGENIRGYQKRTQERMIAARFVEGLEKESPVTEEEIRDYYRSSPKPFITPARMLVKMVEMGSEEDALRALKEMRAEKMDFDEAAGRLRAEGKATVIDYGWVSADFFSPEISSGLMNLGAGQYGGPYKGVSGYYLVRVKERQPERIAAFDEVRDEIRKVLTQQRKAEAYAAWLEGARKHSAIEISLK